MPSCALTWLRVVGLVFVLAGAAQAPLAAPVLTTEEQGSAAGSVLAPARGQPSTGAGGLQPSTAPEASTGNKNLDLLLELQGKGGGDGAMAAKGSAAAAASRSPASVAAAAAAASALAALRAKAAQQPPAEDTPAKPALPVGSGQGLLDEEAKHARPAERRDWSGQAGGGRYDGQPESGGSRVADHALLKLPMEVIAYLRENRFWVLGGIGLLVLLGAAAKAYSRRI